jgi:hypothetical protein
MADRPATEDIVWTADASPIDMDQAFVAPAIGRVFCERPAVEFQ